MTPQAKYAQLRQYMQVKEIAAALGCSRDTLERMARGGYMRRSTEAKLLAMRVPAKLKARKA